MHVELVLPVKVKELGDINIARTALSTKLTVCTLISWWSSKERMQRRIQLKSERYEACCIGPIHTRYPRKVVWILTAAHSSWDVYMDIEKWVFDCRTGLPLLLDHGVGYSSSPFLFRSFPSTLDDLPKLHRRTLCFGLSWNVSKN